MSLLKDNLISPELYNSLPYILDNEKVPQDNQKDINDLLDIFRKYNVPQTMSIKLIHKHFSLKDKEVFVLRDIAVPTQGAVSIMGPMTPQETLPLSGLNYMVDNDGQLQPYEYTISPGPDLRTSRGPDMRQYKGFFKEFSKLVAERNLQRKLGLKIAPKIDTEGTMEFETDEKRGTILVPQDVGGLRRFESTASVSTEWAVDPRISAQCASHCFSHHQVCKGHSSKVESLTNDWFLVGKRMTVGTPLQLIVSTAFNKL